MTVLNRVGGNPERLRRLLDLIGVVYVEKGKPDKAIVFLTESYEKYRAVGDRRGMGAVAQAMGRAEGDADLWNTKALLWSYKPGTGAMEIDDWELWQVAMGGKQF